MYRVAWVLVALLVTGCGKDGSKPPDPKVQLRLNWFPEQEHGGYYAALVEGYYQAEGLDVEILRGGEATPVTTEVSTGSVHFGIVEADDVLRARREGADLVAVMAPFQQTPICIMVHEKSGITSLKDLRDVTLAIGTGAPSYFEYMKKKLPLTNVKVVPYTGGVTKFLVDPNYAQQGFAFSEPILARREKEDADPRALLVSEIGYNPYANVLITRAQLIKQNPDLVRKMVRATLRGWKTYLDTPDKANKHILKVNPVIGDKTLEEGAKVLKPFTVDPTAEKQSLGNMTLERWQQLLSQLEEIGEIPPGKVKASEAFDLQFLPK
jgi:NitT/TauT family transport system substrate-binding protein